MRAPSGEKCTAVAAHPSAPDVSISSPLSTSHTCPARARTPRGEAAGGRAAWEAVGAERGNNLDGLISGTCHEELAVWSEVARKHRVLVTCHGQDLLPRASAVRLQWGKRYREQLFPSAIFRYLPLSSAIFRYLPLSSAMSHYPFHLI
jgi:hypothetical protein